MQQQKESKSKGGMAVDKYIAESVYSFPTYECISQQARSDSCSLNMKLGLCVHVYFRRVCAYVLSNRWKLSGHAPAEISFTFHKSLRLR